MIADVVNLEDAHKLIGDAQALASENEKKSCARGSSSREAMTKLFCNFEEICSRRGRPASADARRRWSVSKSPSRELMNVSRALEESPLAGGHGTRHRPPLNPQLQNTGYGDSALVVFSPSQACSPSTTEELTLMREDWEAEWSKLQAEEEFLLTSEYTWEEILNTKNMSSSQSLELRQELDRSIQENDIWSSSLWGGLENLRSKVSSLRRAAGRHGHNFQTTARNFERELSEFKAQQHQQFDALAKAEQGYEEIQNVLLQRYQGWVAAPSALFRSGSLPIVLHGSTQVLHQSGGSSGSRSRGPSVDPSEATNDPEIEEIRVALEELDRECRSAGGNTGGWSELHHDVFMRTYRQFKMQATPAFFSQLEKRFPDISKSALADHVRWFVEDEQRLDTKRRLLERWRERREELRRDAVAVETKFAAEEAEHLRIAAERDHVQRSETKKRLAEWRSRRLQEEADAVERQNEKEREIIRLEREQRREQLQQRESVEVYKHRREAERLRASEEMKRAKEEQLRAERDHQKEHLRKRELVDAYRRQRELERLRACELKEQSVAASSARRALSQDDRQRIARRNHDLLKRRGQATEDQLNSARSRRGSEPPGKLSVQRSTFDDVPSRLHDPTTAWTQKTLQAAAFEEKPVQNAGVSSEPDWKCQLRTGKTTSDKWPLSRPPTVDSSLKVRALAVGLDTLGRAGVVQPIG